MVINKNERYKPQITMIDTLFMFKRLNIKMSIVPKPIQCNLIVLG